MIREEHQRAALDLLTRMGQGPLPGVCVCVCVCVCHTRARVRAGSMHHLVGQDQIARGVVAPASFSRALGGGRIDDGNACWGIAG